MLFHAREPPLQVTIQSPAAGWQSNLNYNLGIYAQDRWTLNRLTVNGGVRLDFLNESTEEFTLGPHKWLPNRNLHFDAIENVPNWKDVNPRVSAAYDLFGTGKTAVKASWGMYLESTRTGGPYAVGNPTSRIVQSVSRSWTDANRNFTPDCDLLNPVAQDLRPVGGDLCGAFSNSNFGTSTFSNTVDPDLLNGWGVRPADKQLTLSVQHEVLPRVSIDVGYARRTFDNFMVTDNLAVGPNDFDQFYVAAPLDGRLPDGGGYTVSGLYDVKPQFFGRTNNFITLSEKYGRQYVVFNGIDLNVNARLRPDHRGRVGHRLERDETARDAKPGQDMLDEVKRAAVDRLAAHDLVAGLQQRDERG